MDSWDILIKINYIKIKRNITDIEEKIDNVYKKKNPEVMLISKKRSRI